MWLKLTIAGFGVYSALLTGCGLTESDPPGLYFDGEVTVFVGDTTDPLVFRKVGVADIQGKTQEINNYTGVSLSLTNPADSLYLRIIGRRVTGVLSSPDMLRILAADTGPGGYTAEINISVIP